MGKTMETKTYRGRLSFKADEDGGDEGAFEAVFATLNVMDHDGDVTLPGAFGEQDVIIEPWNHGWELPVGKGVIREEGDEALVDGKFFMDIPEARNHYIVAKELQEKQEWSYTFRVLESKDGEFEGRQVRFLEKMEVIGVGQVSRGAGINTRLTAIKSALTSLSAGESEDIQGDDSGANSAGIPTESEAGEPGNESGEQEAGVSPTGASALDYQTLIDIYMEEIS